MSSTYSSNTFLKRVANSSVTPLPLSEAIWFHLRKKIEPNEQTNGIELHRFPYNMEENLDYSVLSETFRTTFLIKSLIRISFSSIVSHGRRSSLYSSISLARVVSLTLSPSW